MAIPNITIQATRNMAMFEIRLHSFFSREKERI